MVRRHPDPDHGWTGEGPSLDLWHDRRTDSNEAYPARMDAADVSARLSISTIDDSLYPAADSFIELSFHGSSETSTDAEECSVSVNEGCRSMGWSQEAPAEVISFYECSHRSSSTKGSSELAETLARRAQFWFFYFPWDPSHNALEGGASSHVIHGL